MKILTAILRSFAVPLLLAATGRLHAQGTAFTYQGQLQNNGSPANGIYDLRFAIYDSTNSPGTLVGGPITNAATGVTNGLFTVTLDFGNQFPGVARWLEIAVRTNGLNNFTTLMPRQQLTPAPYAIYAPTAGTAALASSVAAANITGTFAVAQLPGELVTNNSTNVTLSGAFSGNGGGLTNLGAQTFTELSVQSLNLNGNNSNSANTVQIWDQQRIQWGGIPSVGGLTSSLADVFMNAKHGGVNNGSELQWDFNMSSLNIGPGGWQQEGRVAGGAVTSFYTARNGSASSGTPFISSHLRSWAFEWYGLLNGDSSTTGIHQDFFNVQAIPLNTNGAAGFAVLRFFDPLELHSYNDPQPSVDPNVYSAPRMDIIAGSGVRVYGSLFATNVLSTDGYNLPTNPAFSGPIISNGAAQLWNSNAFVYLRTSRVGATNWQDTLFASPP